MSEPCPHCGTRVRHGARACCCSGCNLLFSPGSAFDRHCRALTCLEPAAVGLVPKVPRSDPDAVMWSLPGDGRWGT